MVTIAPPLHRSLTPMQKLQALAHRFYQGVEWTPKTGDYYTTSRADLELYQVVDVRAHEGGRRFIITRYTTEGQEEAVSEWPDDEFLAEWGFGSNRIWVPDWVFANVTEETFQGRVWPWMLACFGEEVSCDGTERNHRFLEEALELVQACGCTQSEAHQLVDYAYNRPEGDVNQEVGGVMVTLAALCLANGFDMHQAGEAELSRIWKNIEKIRAKQAAKPRHSPLRGHAPTASERTPPAQGVSEKGST